MSAGIELNVGTKSGSGSGSSGSLQIQEGVPLDATLRPVTDRLNTVSPFLLSTSAVRVQQGNFSSYWNYGVGNGDESFSFGGQGNFQLDRAGNAEQAFRIRRSRGTIASPSAVQTGDLLM